MATNAKDLQDYFAGLDAEEERVGEKYGISPDEVRQFDMQDFGEETTPPSLQKPSEYAQPNPRAAVGLERLGLRLNPPVDMPETVPSLSTPSGVPAKTTDFASLQKFMFPDSLKAPEAQPIPVANASPTADATTPMASALAPTGPQNPAPPAGTSSTVKLPPPVVEGAGGDDALGRLSIGQALTRALEGSGSIIAGQNLRSGAADTLGERMKQIEALRAKREEQGITDTRERANNRAQVDYLISRFPDRAEDLQKLYGMTGKPNFSQMLRVEEQVALDRAKKATEEVKPEVARGGLEVKLGTLDERERSNKANEELRRKALLAKQLLDTKTASEIRAAGNDPKAAERAITRAMETAENDKLGIAGNIRDFEGLEKVAPGFTQGTVPSWLGQGGIEAARKVPALNKQATQLSSALETFIAGIRKSLFGASLTGNEKASFDAIVSSGFLMPPDVLAANINRLREGAAKFAQNHFTVAQQLHPEVTGRVLRASTLFGPAVREGGIYSDVWTLPAGASPVSGAGPAAPAPAAQVGGMVRVRHKASGKTATVDRAKADEMLKRPDFEEVK
jgi:hypothetical protein